MKYKKHTCTHPNGYVIHDGIKAPFIIRPHENIAPSLFSTRYTTAQGPAK